MLRFAAGFGAGTAGANSGVPESFGTATIWCCCTGAAIKVAFCTGGSALGFGFDSGGVALADFGAAAKTLAFEEAAAEEVKSPGFIQISTFSWALRRLAPLSCHQHQMPKATARCSATMKIIETEIGSSVVGRLCFIWNQGSSACVVTAVFWMPAVSSICMISTSCCTGRSR